jgi:hypothetical protein
LCVAHAFTIKDGLGFVGTETLKMLKSTTTRLSKTSLLKILPQAELQWSELLPYIQEAIGSNFDLRRE